MFFKWYWLFRLIDEEGEIRRRIVIFKEFLVVLDSLGVSLAIYLLGDFFKF